MGEFYVRYEFAFAAAQLMFAMLGMGATLSISDFVRIVRSPGSLLLGLGTQLGVIPLLAVGVGTSFALSPGHAVGLVLVAAVPGGTMSNIATHLAGGNTALSIAMTAITTTLCLVTTPMILGIFSGDFLPADFEMPAARIAREIALSLLGPLAIGMMVAARWPGRREIFSRVCIRISLGVIGLMILGAQGAGRLDISGIETLLLALATFALAALVVGASPGRLWGVPAEDRLAIGIETCLRNTNLGLLIKASAFPAAATATEAAFADGVFVATLMYGGLGFAMSTPAILLFRRGRL